MWHVQLFFVCWFPTLCFLLPTTSILSQINLRIHHTPSLSPGQIVQVNLADQWQPFNISLHYFISHQVESNNLQVIYLVSSRYCCESYNFLPCFHWLMIDARFIFCTHLIKWKFIHQHCNFLFLAQVLSNNLREQTDLFIWGVWPSYVAVLVISEFKSQRKLFEFSGGQSELFDSETLK